MQLKITEKLKVGKGGQFEGHPLLGWETNKIVDSLTTQIQ